MAASKCNLVLPVLRSEGGVGGGSDRAEACAKLGLLAQAGGGMAADSQTQAAAAQTAPPGSASPPH